MIIFSHLHRAKLWIALTLAVFLLVACRGQFSPRDERSVQLLATVDHVKIAAVWPFEAGGTFFWEGVQMAVEEINARGGVLGRPMRIVKFDDQASVTEGMAVAQLMASDPELFAVVGHRNSFVAIPAAEVYARAGLLYIAPSATSPELTRRGYELTFRTIPSDVSIARQMAQYAASQGHRRLAIAYTDDAYGRGLANAFEDAAEALGIRIVDRLIHFGDVQETRQTVAKWRALNYDGIFVSGAVPRTAEMISLIRQAGAEVPILGGDGLDAEQLLTVAGEHAEGVVFGTVFDPLDPDAAVQKFARDFEARFGVPPDTWAAQGYDAIHLIADAIDQAQSINREAVAEVLRQTTQWIGVTGVHGFDQTGEIVGKPIVRKTVKDGRFVFLGK